MVAVMRSLSLNFRESLAGYRAVLSAPHVRLLFATSFLGRLPVGMTALGVILLVSELTDSYAKAGIVAACLATAAVALPALGRLIDRFGQPRVLLPCAVVFSSSMLGFAALATEETELWLLGLLAAVAGVSFPPLFAAMRSLLGELAGAPDRVHKAFAIDAGVQEVIFVAGPLLVALLVALDSPRAVLVAGALLTLMGTLGFSSSIASRRWRSKSESPSTLGGALAGSGMRTLLLIGMVDGLVFGSLEVVMPAFASAHGSASDAGLLLASVSVGGIVGALWHGARSRKLSTSTHMLILGGIIPLALVPIAVAGSIGQMLAFAFVAGFCIAPTAASSYVLVGELAPPGTVTEAYTWLSAAAIMAGGAGNILAGSLTEKHGVEMAVLSTAAICGLAMVAILLRRETLRVSGTAA